MKNIIPLIIAVVLGLAAVFAVSRTMAKKEDRRDKMVQVLVAKVELKENEAITEEMFQFKEIRERDFVQHQHVERGQLATLTGLTLARTVPAGSFITLRDVIADAGLLSAEVGRQEWAVPVRFSDNALLEHLEAGDEIAIIMVRRVAETIVKPGGNLDDVDVRQYNETVVLFPCVQIMKVLKGTAVVSMTPANAMVLLTANLNGQLYPMLRNRKDDKRRPRSEYKAVPSDNYEAFIVE